MKKTISAMLVAILFLISVNVYAVSVDEAKKNIWKAYHAAFAYEKEDNFNLALENYNKFIEYARYLQDNLGEEHWENIKGLSALANHLAMKPELYVEASNPADAKLYGAKYEPEYGAFIGKSGSFDEGLDDAFLLYVQFGTETIGSFSWRIPKKDDIYLEIAWNVPNENKSDLDVINTGSMDEYIISNLEFVSTLKQKVLLRFGAEVNCWNLPSDKIELTAFIESYKSAFRRIADFARKYAPNAAIVYSPNDISNWYATAEDFYPGDEYVDWVGISSYMNISPSAAYERASFGDAYYCRGYYDNQMVKIKNIVDAFGDRKPILISECGFAYAGDSIQTPEHAIKQLKRFYSYVTMVYPQIKGVMYFNSDFEKNYSLDKFSELKDVYKEAVSSNISFEAFKTGEKKGYTRFSTLNENIDTLKLHLYAQFPTENETSVSYKLDGVGVAHKKEQPYSAVIDVSKLSLGKHTLKVAVSNGNYYTAKDYVFYVGVGNLVGQTEAVLNQPEISVTLNGGKIEFAQAPIIYQGRTLVPLRKIYEALGAEVDWVKETKTIVSTKGNKKVVLQIENKEITISDVTDSTLTRKISLDVPAKLIGGSTLVPARAVSEAFDCTVDWDGKTKTVIIKQ